MALFYSDLVSNPDTVTYEFRFQINGSSDPDFVIPSKNGLTDIVRDSAGTFSITFSEKHPHLVTMSGCLLQSGALGAADGIVVVPTSYTASTGVLIVRTADADAAGAPAAVDPDDNSWVCLYVTFCRKNVLGTSTGVAI